MRAEPDEFHVDARMPSRNQVWNNGHILSSGTPTWPDSLNLAGYDTVLIGPDAVSSDRTSATDSRNMLGDLHARWDKFPACRAVKWAPPSR